MSDKTNIQWTDASWNPTRGCSRVSEGCRNCYAEGVARRFAGPGLPYEGLVTLDSAGKPQRQWNGNIRIVEKHMLDPLKWERPRRIFVNSMSDVFHPEVQLETIDHIFAVMALAPQHTFQILTKRPERMKAYLSDPRTVLRVLNGIGDVHTRNQVQWPLPNVWLGVSCENQETADERIPLLLQTNAAVRFISAEPLLGPIDLNRIPAEEDREWFSTCLTAQDIWWTDEGEISDGPEHAALDWVICGGESGPRARQCNANWVLSIVEQCKAANVACFVKQLGSHVIQGGERRIKQDRKGGDMHEWPHEIRVRQFPQAVTA